MGYIKHVDKGATDSITDVEYDATNHHEDNQGNPVELSRGDTVVVATATATAKEKAGADYYEGDYDGMEEAFAVAIDALTLTSDYVPLKAALASDGGVYTDETIAASVATANDMTLLPATPAVNDAYYFCLYNRFQPLKIIVGTAGVGTWTITWEYYKSTGSWAALSDVVDGTSGFTVAGTNTVAFTKPADWIMVSVNSIFGCWIRARVSAYTSITTQPKGTQAWGYIPINRGVLKITSGVGTFTTCPFIKEGVTVRGSGRFNTILKLMDSCTSARPFLIGNTIDPSIADYNATSFYYNNISIEDLTLDGNRLNNAGAQQYLALGAYFTRAAYCALRRLLVKNCRDSGIYFEYESFGNIVEDIICINNGTVAGNGDFNFYSHDSVLSKIWSYNCSGDVLRVKDSHRLDASSIYDYKSKGRLLVIDNSDYSNFHKFYAQSPDCTGLNGVLLIENSEHTKFKDFDIHDPGDRGVYARDTDNDSLTFENFRIYSAYGTPICLGGDNHRLINCECDSGRNHGLDLLGDHCQVIGGSYKNDQTTTRAGIYIAGDYNKVIGANCSDDQGTPTQKYGIQVASGTSNELIGNTVLGNTTTPILDSGVATFKKDNIGDTGPDKDFVYVKNTSGGSLAAGDVVIASATGETYTGTQCTTTTNQGDDLVLGMATATIADDAYGYIQTLGKTTLLKVDGTTDIAIGDFIGTFTAAKIGMKAGAGDMAFAIALEAYATNDSNGVIDALLITPRKI